MFYSAAYDSLLAAGSRYGAVNGCPLPMPPLPSAKLWSPWLHDPRELPRRPTDSVRSLISSNRVYSVVCNLADLSGYKPCHAMF